MRLEGTSSFFWSPQPRNWKTNFLARLTLGREKKPRESGDAGSLCSIDCPLSIDSVQFSEHYVDFSPKQVQSGHGSIWTFDRKCLHVDVQLSMMLCQWRHGIKFSVTSSFNSIKGGGGTSELHLNWRRTDVREGMEF